MSTEDADPPAGLLAAVADYERALMSDDLDALDRLFAPGDGTLRGDASGVLRGHDAISAFRRSRGGAPARTLLSVDVRAIGPDDALVVAVFAPASGGRGQQTQLWRRGDDGWVIRAAHVSGPAPAVDSTIWRTVGTPLVTGSGAGPLAGASVAVKDLFAVAGHPIGAGVPRYLAEAPVETTTAPAVAALLLAGADVRGIARTDEFAYSIAGRNEHYGSPPNPAVVGGLPGGSTNGPASAVATGQARIGLGTDTGGSLRVPASYQGLWGLRTTHGAVSRDHLVGLAPSFDTVGWITRSADDLEACVAATFGDGDADAAPRRLALVDVSGLGVDDDVLDQLRDAADLLGAAGLDVADTVGLPDLATLVGSFRVAQGFEAWALHGPWILAHPGALGAEIAARFDAASRFTAGEAAEARDVLAAAAEVIRAAAADRVLVLPSASSAAPDARASGEAVERARTATLSLTCLAGTAGLPALSVPVMEVARGPVGLCLVGPPGTDRDLVRLGREVHGVLVGRRGRRET